jgi:hypothetical protein
MFYCGPKKKRTLCSEIQSARNIVYTLEPARLHAVQPAFTLDEIVPAHVNRTIGIAKGNSAAPPQEDYADKEKK